MKKILSGLVLLLAAGGATALFYSEEAAKPGPLLEIHGQLATCETCHQPWKGVSDSACRQCHFFSSVRRLRPAIRFHEAGRHCLQCHTEHQGRKGQIAAMDHTLLHPDLLCSQCHFDPHGGLFGQNCRECHGITGWNIESFQHPSRERKDCRRCHKAPQSHRASGFKKRILQTHERVFPDEEAIVIKDCWRCHITHDWRHLLMEHE
ncbi:MAG: hypothetical protein ACLFV2_05400 [Desulfurivibrionaceae bacterium]